MKLSNRFGNASLPLQFIVLLSLILIGLIISMLLIALSPLLIQWGIGDKSLLYLVMLIQSFGLFILPAYFTAYLLGKSPVQYLHMDKSPTWFQIFAVILILFTATPMMNRIIEWNENLSLPESMAAIEQWMRSREESAAEVTRQLLQMSTFGNLLIVLLLVSILTGIGEEMMFRGIIQRILYAHSHRVHFAIWFCAILFSAVHLQFYGFVPRMLLGAFFGYLVVWTGSLWVPIIAHAFNNGMAVVLSYIYDVPQGESIIEQFGTADRYSWMAWVSLLLTAALIVLFKRMSPKEN